MNASQTAVLTCALLCALALLLCLLPRSARADKPQEVALPHMGEGAAHLGWIPVQRAAPGETLTLDLHRFLHVFRYHAHPGKVERVTIAGGFNSWNRDANPMEKTGRRTFEPYLPMPSGGQEYKFVVDGTWIAAPAGTTAPNGKAVFTLQPMTSAFFTPEK